MEKVKEPFPSEIVYCRRCDHGHCGECIDYIEVDFDVEEISNENHPNPNAPRIKENWKGEEVCPWCYNQLIDLKEKTNK